MATNKPLRDLLLESMQSVAGVAPSAMMVMRRESVSAALDFAESKAEAAYAEKRLRQYLSDPNWLLSERSLDEAFQLIGELQFWMMSEASGVALERIPETDKKTPDFKTASSIPEVRFEVKALSVASGQFALGEMAENSFKTQLDLQAQITAGRKVAMAESVIAPHGSPKPGIGQITSVCRRLIEKARQNIKADQYRGAKTFLVLNLILIDSGYTGQSELRPIAAGYPEDWSVRTGALWTLGFGYPEQMIQSPPEFEGKPGVEGKLGLAGILVDSEFEDVSGLLMIVHPLREQPRIFGLFKSRDMDDPSFEILMKLAGEFWNDEGDSNGWRLNET